MKQIIKQQICEVRYKPNPEIIDNRGALINYLVELLGFEKWGYSNDGFSLKTSDGLKEVFVAIDRCGVRVNSSDSDEFKVIVSKFLRFVFSIQAFSEKAIILRIGVRSREGVKHSGNFKSLVSKFSKNYFYVNDKVISELDMSLEDIGFPLIFKDGNDKVNTNCGPMREIQLKEYFDKFEHISNWPDTSLYVDVDYFCTPNEEISLVSVIKKVETYCVKVEEKLSKIKQIVLR